MKLAIKFSLLYFFINTTIYIYKHQLIKILAEKQNLELDKINILELFEFINFMFAFSLITFKQTRNHPKVFLSSVCVIFVASISICKHIDIKSVLLLGFFRILVGTCYLSINFITDLIVLQNIREIKYFSIIRISICLGRMFPQFIYYNGITNIDCIAFLFILTLIILLSNIKVAVLNFDMKISKINITFISKKYVIFLISTVLLAIIRRGVVINLLYFLEKREICRKKISIVQIIVELAGFVICLIGPLIEKYISLEYILNISACFGCLGLILLLLPIKYIFLFGIFHGMSIYLVTSIGPRIAIKYGEPYNITSYQLIYFASSDCIGPIISAILIIGQIKIFDVGDEKGILENIVLVLIFVGFTAIISTILLSLITFRKR